MSQTCPTLCDPRDYTVHGILQTRILDWVAFPFSRRSSQPRDQTQVSLIACRFYPSHQGRPKIKYAWCSLLGRKAMTNLNSILKSRETLLCNKGPSSQSYGFSMVMYGCESWDYKESWALKNWCFRTVLEKILESPLDCKEIQPVHPKGNQSWIFTGRTDAEPETPILWPPDAKSWLIGKDLDTGKDLRQEEKGSTEDEMSGWHHQLDGHEFEQALGVGDGQGSLVCCTPWCLNELDLTEQLNWTELIIYV